MCSIVNGTRSRINGRLHVPEWKERKRKEKNSPPASTCELPTSIDSLHFEMLRQHFNMLWIVTLGVFYFTRLYRSLELYSKIKVHRLGYIFCTHLIFRLRTYMCCFCDQGLSYPITCRVISWTSQLIVFPPSDRAARPLSWISKWVIVCYVLVRGTKSLGRGRCLW